MGRINIHFPKNLEKEIRRRAKTKHKSLSKIVIEITQRELKPTHFPKKLWDLFGSWKDSDFCEKSIK